MRKRRLRTGVLAAATIGVALAGASPAMAAGSSSGGRNNQQSSAAVVTPLLNMFEFGDNVGMPLACNAATSIIASGDAGAAPFLNSVNGQCLALSQKGGAYLSQAVADSSALAAANPVIDPLLSTMSAALTTIGTTYGPSLAPFGSTISGSAATVAFFEGS